MITTRPTSSCEVEFQGRTPAVGGNTAAAYSGTPTFRRGFRAHGDGPPNREKHIMKHPVGLAPPAGGMGPTFQVSPGIVNPNLLRHDLSRCRPSTPLHLLHRRPVGWSLSRPQRSRWCRQGRQVIPPPPVIVQAARYSSSVMPARSNADASSAGSSIRACPVQSSQPLIGAARSCGVGRPRPSSRCLVILAR